MKRSIENKFYDLLGKKLSGDATEMDLNELQDLLAVHREFQFLYDQSLSGAGKMVVPEEQSEQAFAAHYVKKLHFMDALRKESPAPKVPVRKRARLVWFGLSAAAAVAGVIFLVYFFAHTETVQSKTTSKGEMVTPRASISKIRLPDGTVVTMNADSKLTYGGDFFKSNREVTLAGEAFFDVVHDAAHPFVIHTKAADVKVLGTVFNVRNYPGDKIFETTLIKGKVEVIVKGLRPRHIILKPSEKITIKAHQNSKGGEAWTQPAVQLTPVVLQNNVMAEASWIDNKLAFSNEPLETIALELERKFNVEVIFQNDTAKKYRYTGIFDGSDMQEILQILQLSKKFNYQLDKNRLIIK
jgi:ferric-dicitrate binding protein FerR (iron transport regulator)